MASFTLYTYQFAPHQDYIHDQVNLFGETYLLSAENAMRNKNDIFAKAISTLEFKHQRQVLNTQILYNENGVLVFRLANKKRYKTEENFVIKISVHEPSVLIFIDNRSSVQKIAIEQNLNVFSDTSVVAGIIGKSIDKMMKENNLILSIKKQYKESEFWETIAKYKDAITMLRFHFQYPNLPSSKSKASALLKSITKDIAGASATAQFDAENGSVLSLNRDNETLAELNRESANTGNNITFRIRGEKRKNMKIGKSITTFEMDIEGKTDKAADIISLIKEIQQATQNDV